jgi:hypothetical protein
MEQMEDGKEDHNVLGVIRGDTGRLDSKTREALVEFVSHVFDHVAGKAIRAGNFLGQREALHYIAKHRDAAMDA